MPDIEVELTGSPAVNVAARPVPVELTADTPTVALTVDTAAVNLDVNAVVGGSVPDGEWTEVDLTSSWTDVFTGEAFSWGTGGECRMRYTRIGRTVSASIIGYGAADHSTTSVAFGIGMRPFLDGSTLPYLPYSTVPGPVLNTRFSAWPYSSYFAYCSKPESTPFAGDGILEPLGPVISGGLVFVHMRAQIPAGGPGSNVWSITGDVGGTEDFTGDTFEFVASIAYEAATAA